MDYTIQVPAASNNGHEQPIVLARRKLAAGATSDTFSTKVISSSTLSISTYLL